MSKHIVILGAGYGGLLSALTVRKYLTVDDAYVTVINRDSTHQIITELHRLAAGNVAEKAVALPLEKLLRGKDIELKIATVNEISPDNKEVSLSDGSKITYDALVVALGSETAFFGIPGLQENGFTLKSVDEAKHIRDYVEARVRDYATSKDKADATFVVGGGGLTGIELVGEFADRMPELTKKYGVDPKDISLYVAEAAPTILPGFPEELIERATTSLEKRGVTFVTGVPVSKYEDNVVELKDGRKIETKTMVWTGGVQGNSVVANSGIEVNRGRATVNEYLQSTSHENIFIAGDSAVVFAPGAERPYPPTAQISWQMGEQIGYNLFAYLKNGALEAFNPVFSGTLGSLGRKDAIATIGGNKTQLKGLPASLMKEASNLRYLAHINGLFTLAY
ncbi:NADH dehydrogenase [Pullulanibacillus pueri]|uniref:NADH dehydrogenase-like protein YjlD n=1 Tax=Pullulanibacillus pueri TaxID=1437324 RepID=A0A8J2ZSG5_9BACL|nr:NAD(P)/FAD-dependent oxidoreductase [Pullulanibacillus pueri]MBM7680328.1 NADH dehydrogenase [Pullulanibacillus pueri]GGH75631.1 NADH dehydrogenase-like protein YjlD [Pullulanibacillus pueri]